MISLALELNNNRNLIKGVNPIPPRRGRYVGQHNCSSEVD